MYSKTKVCDYIAATVCSDRGCYQSASLVFTHQISGSNSVTFGNDNLLDVMTLAFEQLQFVQHQLNYHFSDVSRLVTCFRAAHRSDFEDVADDGNRTLARTGVTIMDLVEKRRLSAVGTEPHGRMDVSMRL